MKTCAVVLARSLSDPIRSAIVVCDSYTTAKVVADIYVRDGWHVELRETNIVDLPAAKLATQLEGVMQ